MVYIVYDILCILYYLHILYYIILYINNTIWSYDMFMQKLFRCFWEGFHMVHSVIL